MIWIMEFSWIETISVINRSKQVHQSQLNRDRIDRTNLDVIVGGSTRKIRNINPMSKIRRIQATYRVIDCISQLRKERPQMNQQSDDVNQENPDQASKNLEVIAVHFQSLPLWFCRLSRRLSGRVVRFSSRETVLCPRSVGSRQSIARAIVFSRNLEVTEPEGSGLESSFEYHRRTTQYHRRHLDVTSAIIPMRKH